MPYFLGGTGEVGKGLSSATRPSVHQNRFINRRPLESRRFYKRKA